jgi:hypothetical protein
VDSNGSQDYCGVMGLFGGKTKTAPEPITFDEAIVALGLPAGTILRESEDVWNMWCDSTGLPRNGDAMCYPVQLANLGSSVAVMLAGKKVGQLDPRCLPTAVAVLKRYGGKTAPAVLFLGSEGSRTDRVRAFMG